MHFCIRDGRLTVLVFFQIAEICTLYNSIIKFYAFLLVGMLMDFCNFELFQLRTFPTSYFSNFEVFQLWKFPTSNFSNFELFKLRTFPILSVLTLLKPSPLQLAACSKILIFGHFLAVFGSKLTPKLTFSLNHTAFFSGKGHILFGD